MQVIFPFVWFVMLTVCKHQEKHLLDFMVQVLRKLMIDISCILMLGLDRQNTCKVGLFLTVSETAVLSA